MLVVAGAHMDLYVVTRTIRTSTIYRLVQHENVPCVLALHFHTAYFFAGALNSSIYSLYALGVALPLAGSGTVQTA